MSTSYPFAPLKPREIPIRLTMAAIDYGVQFAQNRHTGDSSAKMLDLEDRVRADLLQADLGPLSAVTR